MVIVQFKGQVFILLINLLGAYFQVFFFTASYYNLRSKKANSIGKRYTKIACYMVLLHPLNLKNRYIYGLRVCMA